MKLFPLSLPVAGSPALRFGPSLLLGCLLLAASPAWSQTVLENAALLGMSRQDLAPALPDARPVSAPRRLSSGAAGLLRVADTVCEGEHFEQTLYFSHQTLQQMDLVLRNPASGAGAQEAVSEIQAGLMQALRARLGPELAAFGAAPGAIAQTASWVSGGADVMLFRSGRPDHPTLRMVIRQRQLVDASAL